MSGTRLRVVIAGGGIAGLETLTALRALAGDRVAPTLVAPEDEFVYRPLTATEPYSVGRLRQVSLDRAAMDAGAPFIAATVDAVDPGGRSTAGRSPGCRPTETASSRSTSIAVFPASRACGRSVTAPRCP